MIEVLDAGLKKISVMLKSAVNLLGDTSAVWNSQYLRKVLRIPEDQLEILNSIPGWSSETDSNKPSSSVNTGNLLVSSIVQTEAIVGSQKNIVASSEETIEHLKDNYKEITFPLRKSSSLDCVSFLNSDSSQQRLKRSSSTSNIRNKVVIFQNSSLHTLEFDIRKKNIFTESSLSNIEEVEEMQVNRKNCSFEKSSYASSGVQCKMSQDLSLEINASQAPTLHPNNYIGKKETLKLLDLCSPSANLYGGEKMIEKVSILDNKNNQLSDLDVMLKKNLNEKTKVDVDKSYISLSVPCAQPPSANIHHNEDIVTDPKERTSAPQSEYLNSTSKNVPTPFKNGSLHPSGKRKRKSKQEKSKKHRSANADCIKIEYSSEQIKNMIELMKILHNY